MLSISSLCKATVIGAALISNSVRAAENWFLMARHGECAAIKSLERTFPDMGRISEPEGFVKYVQGKGLKARTEMFQVQTGKAVQVFVPERSISPIFVTPENCSKTNVER